MIADTPLRFPTAGLTDADLPESPLDPAQVVAGEPVVRHLALHDHGGVAVGVWQHGAGTSTDVEADEVFVVLSGRAIVAFEGHPDLEVGPGDVVVLPEGVRSTWTVHETLRKVYVAPR
jgi:uncharacterized cupin superfamily protein